VNLFYTDNVTDIQSVITQLEQQKAAIDTAIAALRGLDSQPAVPARGPGRPKGSVTRKQAADVSEGRQRQIEAMRQYWAKRRAGKKKAAPAKASRKGGSISPEGRKRLAEAMRQRWAAKRAD
jgi:hypothetical protein